LLVAGARRFANKLRSASAARARTLLTTFLPRDGNRAARLIARSRPQVLFKKLTRDLCATLRRSPRDVTALSFSAAAAVAELPRDL